MHHYVTGAPLLRGRSRSMSMAQNLAFESTSVISLVTANRRCCSFRCRCALSDRTSDRLCRIKKRYCSICPAWPIGLKASKMVLRALLTFRSSSGVGKLYVQQVAAATLSTLRPRDAETHHQSVCAGPAANRKLRVARLKSYKSWRPTRRWYLCKV